MAINNSIFADDFKMTIVNQATRDRSGDRRSPAGPPFAAGECRRPARFGDPPTALGDGMKSGKMFIFGESPHTAREPRLLPGQIRPRAVGQWGVNTRPAIVPGAQKYVRAGGFPTTLPDQ